VSLTIAELEHGITYWLTETSWDRDFHLAFYQMMAEVNPNGAFDDVWWATFLPILRAWRATRPRGSAFLSVRTQERVGALTQAWARAVEPNVAKDIETVEWSSVSAFPEVVTEIKDVRSPVFTSKFCHFLVPRIFPLVDGAAMGNPYPTYEACFLAYQGEWATTPEPVRETLVARLARRIGSPAFGVFPFKNKVVELCMIGRRYG